MIAEKASDMIRGLPTQANAADSVALAAAWEAATA